MANQEVAGLLVSIDGNTVRLRNEIDKAKTAAREFSTNVRATTREANGAIALLGEEFGIHLPRHVRSFLASLPGASVFAELLPAAAVAGLGLAFVEAGKRAYEFIEKIREAPRALAEGFQEMANKAQLSTDELDLTNAKLQEQLDKLSGHPVNRLAAELATARVEAEKLLDALTADNKQIESLIKEHSVGTLGSLLGKVSTVGYDDVLRNQAKERVDLTSKYAEQLQSANTQAEKERVEQEKRTALNALEVRQLKDLKDLHDQIAKDSSTPGGTGYGADWSAVLALLKGGADILTKEINKQQSQNANADLQGAIGNKQDSKDRATEARKEHQQLIQGMLDDSRIAAAEQERIDEALAETARKFFAEDAAEERQKREAEAQAREDFRQQVQEKAAGYDIEVQSARGAYQEIAELSQLRVQLGMETNAQRNAELQAALDAEYQQEKAALEAKLALYGSWTAEYQKVTGELKKLDEDYYKHQLQLAAEAASTGIGGALDELIKKARDTQAELKEMVSSTITSMNNEMAKAITGQRTSFGGAFKSLGQSLAKMGLQRVEAEILPHIPGMSKIIGAGKLGTQENPMWVRSVTAGAAGAGIGDLAGVLSGAATSKSGGSGFSQILSSILNGFRADGGTVSSGNYLVGERGPELLSIGSTGYVHNARETASMMTSSEPAAFYHIDATGANAAEIDQRVARALAVVHPRVVRDSVMVQRELARRSPRR